MVERAGCGLGDLLLPRLCLACDAWIASAGPLLCGDCAGETDELAQVPYCPRCGRNARPETLDAGGCPRCRREREWNIGQTVRIGPHERVLRELVLRLKYGGRTQVAALLAPLLAQRIRQRGLEVDALAPVPMHRLRRMQRPCNHALVLAEALGRELGLPVVQAVRRTRYRRSQTEMLTRNQRFENVRGCFSARPQPLLLRWLAGLRGGESVRGRRVCIVDNLLVAGATVHEVAVALRKLGAASVHLAVLTRQARSGDAGVAAVESGGAWSDGPAAAD